MRLSSKQSLGAMCRYLSLCVALLCVCAVETLGSGQVQDIVDVATQSNDASFVTRQQAVAGLSNQLDHESITKLYEFMEQKSVSGLNRGELLALKDAICTRLENQSSYPDDLSQRLMVMYDDRSQDEGWRDYCIQHLNAGYSKTAPEERKDIAGVLWKAAEESAGSIPGTALIALKDNIDDKHIIRADVADKALEIVKSNSRGNAAKMTALQICAQLGEKRCLPLARNIAASSKVRMLRLSAIAAIGVIGNPEDRAILQKHASSSDRQTRIAAETALAKMSGASKKAKRL